MICFKKDDFSLSHMEDEIKKLKREHLQDAAQRIKESIRAYQIWSDSGHIDGWEKKSVDETLAYLKEARYILNRYM